MHHRRYPHDHVTGGYRHHLVTGDDGADADADAGSSSTPWCPGYRRRGSFPLG